MVSNLYRLDLYNTQHYSVAWLCSIQYLAYDTSLHWLIFAGRNLVNKKKPMLVQIMNNVGIFSDSAAKNSIFGE